MVGLPRARIARASGHATVVAIAVLAACAVVVQGATAGSEVGAGMGKGEYRDIQSTKELTSGSKVFNRFGYTASTVYQGRGAITCDEYGDAHFIRSASLSVEVDGVEVVGTSPHLTSLSSLVNHNSKGSNKTTTPATVRVFEHATYACLSLVLPEGVTVPTHGHITVSGTFGESEGAFTRMGFNNFDNFTVDADFNVVGKKGSQTLSLAMGPPPEVGEHYVEWLEDDVPMYLVAEPAAKLTMSPVGGVVDDMLIDTATIHQVELLVPSNVYNTPTPPQLKDAGYNYLRVYLPRQLNHKPVLNWTISYAGAGESFFSTPIVGGSGEEVEMDGLSPMTTYHVLACAQHPLGPPSCYTLLGTTSEYTGRGRYVASGIGGTFPLDSNNGVEFTLPSRICDDCDDFVAVQLVITKLFTGRPLLSKTYTMGGVYQELGFNTKYGYDCAIHYTFHDGTTQTYKEGFRPGSSADEGATLETVGRPSAFRLAPSIVVVRVPTRLEEGAPAIKSVSAVIRNARSLAVLVETTFTEHDTDHRLDHVPSTGPLRVDLTVTDERRQSSSFVTVLNAASSQPSSRLVGEPVLSQQPPSSVVVDVPAKLTDDAPQVQHCVFTATNPLTQSTLASTTVYGPGKGTLRMLPDRESFRVVTEVTDQSMAKRVFDTLVVADRSVFLVPEWGTPVLTHVTGSSAFVTVPSLLQAPTENANEADLVPVDGVEVVVRDLVQDRDFTSSVQDGAGTVVVEGSLEGRVIALTTTVRRGQQQEVYRTVPRASGLPPFEPAGPIAVFFQHVNTRPPTQRVVVRLPHVVHSDQPGPVMPSVPDDHAASTVQIEIRNGDGEVIGTKTALQGSDVVFDNFDMETALTVSVKHDGGQEEFHHAAMYSAVTPDKALATQRVGDDGRMPPFEQPLYGGALLYPVLDGVVVRVTRFVEDGSSAPVDTAYVTVTSSSKGREGKCEGRTIFRPHPLKPRTDTLLPLPMFTDVDVCVELETVRGSSTFQFHVPALTEGAVPPMELSGKAGSSVLPVAPGSVVVRVPPRALMSKPDSTQQKMADVVDCEIKAVTSSGVVVFDRIGGLGDTLVTDLPTNGEFDVEVVLNGGAVNAVKTTHVVNSEQQLSAVEPPLPPFGPPSALYEHEFGVVIVSVPKLITPSGLKAKDTQYKMTIGGERRSFARGTVVAGEVETVQLPPRPPAPASSVIVIDFVTTDVNGQTHESTVQAHRISRDGFPPLPPAGYPYLMTSHAHRLVLRVPPRLSTLFPPIKRANTTLAYCDAPRDVIWYTVTHGGGDAEVPGELVSPHACYRVVSAVTNFDDAVWPLRWEFDMATAELPPLRTQGPVGLVPVGDGVMVVRIPTLRPDEDMDKWAGQRVFVNVTDAFGNPLFSKELKRGEDSVISTPCWTQDCAVTIWRRTQDGTAIDLKTSVGSSLTLEYRDPKDPDLWTAGPDEIVVKNADRRDVVVRIDTRDDQTRIASEVYKEKGYFPIAATPATVYHVVMEWKRPAGENVHSEFFLKTPRLSTAGEIAFEPAMLPAATTLTVQVPQLSNGQRIRLAQIFVYPRITPTPTPAAGEEVADAGQGLGGQALVGVGAQAADNNNNNNDDDQFAVRSDSLGRSRYDNGDDANGTNSTNGTGLYYDTDRLAFERELVMPTPGEHVNLEGLAEGTNYTVVMNLTNLAGMVESVVINGTTGFIPFVVTSTHQLLDKTLQPNGTNELVVQARSPMPQHLFRMLVAHEDMADRAPVADYKGSPTPDALKISNLPPGRRYRIGWSLQNTSMAYYDNCAFVSSDAPMGTEQQATKPTLLRVTQSQAHILLPKRKGVGWYMVSKVVREEGTGRELGRRVMYKGVGEPSSRGSVYIARALPSNTDHEFVVQAFKDDGGSYNPVPLKFTTDSVFQPCILGRPSQPREPMLMQGSLARYSRRFLIAWNKVQTNQGHNATAYPVTGYDVEALCSGYRGSIENPAFQVVRHNLPPDTNTFMYAKLTPGFDYVMRIVAWNFWGESEKGFRTEVRIPSEEPEPPARPEIDQVTPRSAHLMWRAPYHNGEIIDSYRVECSPGLNASVRNYPSHHSASDEWEVYREGGLFLDMDLARLIPARNYSCRVYARNVLGWSRPSEPVVFWTMSDTPETPVNPRATGIGRYFANLVFDKPRHNGLPVLGYDVEVKRPGQNFAVHESCDDTTRLECPVGTLLPGDTYSFRVNAENCAGKSVWSPVVTFTALPAPPDPTTNLQLVSAAPRSLTLGWDTGRHNGRPISKHSVECDGGKTCYSGAWQRPSMPPCMQLTDDVLPEGGDKTDPARFADFRSVWAMDVADGGDSDAVLTPVRPATTYRCRAYAWNSEGRSNTTDYIIVRTDDTVPDAPPNVHVVEQQYSELFSDVRIALAWDEAIPNGQYIEAYTLFRKNVTRTHTSTGMQLANAVTAGGQWEELSQSLALMSSAEQLRPDTTFQFKVQATNSLGVGPPTVFSVKTIPGKPEQPMPMELNAKAPTWLEVTCPPVDDAGSEVTRWTVEMAAGAVSQSQLDDDDLSQFGVFEKVHEWLLESATAADGDGYSRLRISNLEQGTDYMFRCQCENAVGTSAYSETVVFATDAAEPDPPAPPQPFGEAYHTQTSLVVSFTLPDDNGKRISACHVQVGGSWEWGEHGGAMEGFSADGSRTPVDTTEGTVDVSQPYPVLLVFDTTSLLTTRQCDVCHEETDGTIHYKDLLPAHEYSFRVKCENEVGNSSLSNPIYLQTDGKAPNPPDAPADTPEQTSVALTLDHPFEYGAAIQKHRTQFQCVYGSCDPDKCSFFNAATNECVEPFTEDVAQCSQSCEDAQQQQDDCEACTIAGLSPGTQYRVWSFAYNQYGWSDQGAVLTFTTLPSVPLPVREIQTSSVPDTVTVKWVAPAFNQGSPVLRYHVRLLCDPAHAPQAECEDIEGTSANGLSSIAPSSRQVEVTDRVASGAHYLVHVNAENAQGLSDDATVELWVAGSPAAGVQRPALITPLSNGVRVGIPPPTLMHGAELLLLEVGLAEVNTDSWRTETVMPAAGGATTVHELTGMDAAKFYVVRVRAKSHMGACGLAGNTCSDWSVWSRPSNALRVVSDCPTFKGEECAGHGMCDKESSRCYCRGSFMGTDCSIPVDIGQTCVSQDNGEMQLWEATGGASLAQYSFNHPEVGEFVLYKSVDRPLERVHVRRELLLSSLGVGVGMTGAALMFEGHTIAIHLDPQSPDRCAVVTHNCHYVMSEEADEYVAFSKTNRNSQGQDQQQRLVVKRDCDSPLGQIVVANEFTDTELTCERWPNPSDSNRAEGFLISCSLVTRRRNCQGIVGYKRNKDKTIASTGGAHHVGTSSVSEDQDCAAQCNNDGRCQLFVFNHDAEGTNNCVKYGLSAYYHVTDADFADVYVSDSASFAGVCRSGVGADYSSNVAPGSSCYSSSAHCGCGYVTNGNTHNSGCYNLFLAQYQYRPHVTIRLPQARCVNRVDVHARTDAHGNLEHAQVFVLTNGAWQQCGSGSSPGYTGAGYVYRVDCEYSDVTEVRVQRYDHGEIAVTEIRVFAEPTNGEVASGDGPALTCAYDFEEGLCGVDGFSHTDAASNSLSPKPLTAVTGVDSLFDNGNGGVCEIPAQAAAAAAVAATSASLVQTDALTNVEQPTSHKVTTIEPTLVMSNNNEDADVVALVEMETATEAPTVHLPLHRNHTSAPPSHAAAPEHRTPATAHHPTPSHPTPAHRLAEQSLAQTLVQSRPVEPEAGSGAHVLQAQPLEHTHRVGVIDASLRPQGRHVLGKPLVDMHAEVAQAASQHEIRSPTALVSTDAHTLPAPPQPAVAAVGRHGATAKPTHNPVRTQHALMQALSKTRTPLPPRHRSYATSHVMPHAQVLQQQAVNITDGAAEGQGVAAGSWTVECPEECASDACDLAQASCKDIEMCRATCVHNICGGESAEFAVSKATRCDARTVAAMENAAAKQAELDDEANSFVAESGGALAECPMFVSGGEPWNVAPFDESIAAWTEETLPLVSRLMNGEATNSTTTPTTLGGSVGTASNTTRAIGRHHRSNRA